MTEYYLGKREQIAICPEDSYATLGTKTMAADGYILGKNTKIETNFSVNWQEILTSGSDTLDIDSREKGSLSYPFTITFIPTDWKFLKYCAHGSVTNTGTSPTVHTFSTTDEVSSFTTEWSKRGNPNRVLTITGCVIKKWNLKFSKSAGAGEGTVTIIAECLAQSISKGTSITSISNNTDDTFQFRMAKLTYDSTEVVEINNGEISCDIGVDDNDSRYCNATLDQLIGEPIKRVRRYTYRFNINEKDSTYFDDWENQAVISGTNTFELIRGTSPADDCVFTFNNLSLDAAIAPTNIEGIDNVDLIGVPVSVDIVAKDDKTDY